MNLEMEVLDNIHTPMSAAEGVAAAVGAFAAGIIIGLIIT